MSCDKKWFVGVDNRFGNVASFISEVCSILGVTPNPTQLERFARCLEDFMMPSLEITALDDAQLQRIKDFLTIGSCRLRIRRSTKDDQGRPLMTDADCVALTEDMANFKILPEDSSLGFTHASYNSDPTSPSYGQPQTPAGFTPPSAPAEPGIIRWGASPLEMSGDMLRDWGKVMKLEMENQVIAAASKTPPARAFACLSYGCPERPPAPTLGKCYTCGKMMVEVEVAVSEIEPMEFKKLPSPISDYVTLKIDVESVSAEGGTTPGVIVYAPGCISYTRTI